MPEPMTLPEWTKEIRDLIEAAGFTVSEYEGFPLVAVPITLADKVRVLKLPLPFATDRTIYAEGILITPHQ